MFPLDDTIAAIASPPGGAARGIVRISGPKAVESVVAAFHAQGGCVLAGAADASAGRQRSPHVLPGSLCVDGLHSPIPCELYLWCKCPVCGGNNDNKTEKPVEHHARSYTGQPVVEIHTIGSPPLLDMILRAVCSAGARLAGPGEFTLRAFLAGRIDLTQAEAVLGVIDADDRRSLAAALDQLAGGLARPLHRLRDELLDLLAHVEAGFDFADEDLPFIARDELVSRLADARTRIAAVERQMESRSEPADRVRVVLVGRPNSGKSSLFNAIVGSGSALVSHQPGTTRDYLTAEIDLDGVRFQLVDTAGIAADSHGTARADRDAQKAAAGQRREADVELFCLDSTRPIDDWERSELAEERILGRRVVALTKCDAIRGLDVSSTGIATSSLTGEGVELLRSLLRETVLDASRTGSDAVASTAARCGQSLRLARESLERASSVAASGQEELAAAEVRTALEELGKVVGDVYTDDVLERIFSRFCVGK